MILYTCATSVAYTLIVAYFAKNTEAIPLGISATILIALTALIAFGRELLSDVDNAKKLAVKDAEICALKLSVKQKQAMLHSVKSKVIHEVINNSNKDEFFMTMREIATLLNVNLAINNVEFEDGVDGSGYLDVLAVNAKVKV